MQRRFQCSSVILILLTFIELSNKTKMAHLIIPQADANNFKSNFTYQYYILKSNLKPAYNFAKILITTNDSLIILDKKQIIHNYRSIRDCLRTSLAALFSWSSFHF